MNNQIAMTMRNQMTQNPRLFAQNMLKTGYFNNNPVYSNALNAVANGDNDKIRELAGNLCKEHGVSVDDAMSQYQQFYGIR